LLASMAVGGMIGAWLSDSGSAISVGGMIVGGFIILMLEHLAELVAFAAICLSASSQYIVGQIART
jgi:hypothetical protein